MTKNKHPKSPMKQRRMREEEKEEKETPFVSICTPTFNRRPFIPMMVKCFQDQDYPKEKMEWIIIDDGTDKIEDLVAHLPQVKYYYYKEKMCLGKKRNVMHEKCKGEILVYMDDDDYYPKERVSHAVETLLKNPQALCAGSSLMHIYYKDLQKMYQFGPYGPNHSTAATFAFRRELLTQTRYEENASLAEETYFLKNYTIPFVQLDSCKSILVFSHIHNSYNKNDLLKHLANSRGSLSSLSVDDFIIGQPEIKDFFLNQIDGLLEGYAAGKPENKPDVVKKHSELVEKRDNHINMIQKLQQHIQSSSSEKEKEKDVATVATVAKYEKKLTEQSEFIQDILRENGKLREKVQFLENKVKKLIDTRIEEQRLSKI